MKKPVSSGYRFTIKNINNPENAECKEGFKEFRLRNVNFKSVGWSTSGNLHRYTRSLKVHAIRQFEKITY